MGGRGRAGRLMVGVTIASLLGGCGPLPRRHHRRTLRRPSTEPRRLPVATPSASAVSPPATIELTGFSVRPFGLAVTTSAYFAVDVAGNVYLPGGSWARPS